MRNCILKDWPNNTLYEDGRLYSEPRFGSKGGWMNFNLIGGYPFYGLRHPGRKKRAKVHMLLAENFIPNPDNKPLVLHKDDNKMNWSLDNLYWGDWSDNNYDTWDNTRERKSYKFMTDYGVEVSTTNLPLLCKKLGLSLGTVQASIRRDTIVYIKKRGILLEDMMKVNESTKIATI